MLHWNLIVWLIVALVVVVGGFILVRTSGDGRPALRRLTHPTKGGIQEEYGGDGEGHRIRGTGRVGAPRPVPEAAPERERAREGTLR